jgi:hypothetical protein
MGGQDPFDPLAVGRELVPGARGLHRWPSGPVPAFISRLPGPPFRATPVFILRHLMEAFSTSSKRFRSSFGRASARSPSGLDRYLIKACLVSRCSSWYSSRSTSSGSFRRPPRRIAFGSMRRSSAQASRNTMSGAGPTAASASSGVGLIASTCKGVERLTRLPRAEIGVLLVSGRPGDVVE